MPMANQPLLAFIGQKARMTINEIGNLGLDGLRQKLPRTTAQNFSQRILECAWLGELNDIILGHGVSSFNGEWRHEHPHDTPPHLITPSPTFATYRSTLQMITDHPWFGTGLGTFVWSFPRYRSADDLSGVWDLAHSTPLELVADIGIPLATVIALGWILVLALLIRAARRHRRGGIVVPLAALSVALIGLLHSMVDFSLQIPGYAIVAFGVVGAGLGQSFGPRLTK